MREHTPRKDPELELPIHPDLHRVLQSLIDIDGDSQRVNPKTYDLAAIEKTYMVETPASMAAASVNSVAKALLQRCDRPFLPLTHVTHASGRR
jgi:hypothetical protein